MKDLLRGQSLLLDSLLCPRSGCLGRKGQIDGTLKPQKVDIYIRIAMASNIIRVATLI